MLGIGELLLVRVLLRLLLRERFLVLTDLRLLLLLQLDSLLTFGSSVRSSEPGRGKSADGLLVLHADCAREIGACVSRTGLVLDHLLRLPFFLSLLRRHAGQRSAGFGPEGGDERDEMRLW